MMRILKTKNTLARNRFLRWLLLMVGLGAIIALTGMNVFSLYDIRNRVTESENERQLKKAEDITLIVRDEIYTPFNKLLNINDDLEATLEQGNRSPETLISILADLSNNPYINSIYYTPVDKDPCINDESIFYYNKDRRRIQPTNNYSTLLCDGVGLIRSTTRIQVNNFDLRWRAMIEFDAHRSMNIGLINLAENRVVGYFTFILNQDMIVESLIAPLIKNYFEPSNTSGTVVWLHDHKRDIVLASSDPSVPFDVDLIDQRVRFPRFFGDWNIKIAFINPPISSAYQETFLKNIIVLGTAVLFLMGSLLFMFYTAQKERALSQRQAGFLANVTHELKTPLAVMQAAGENIADGRVTEPKRLKRYGSHIYDESVRLRKMIEKLLDVAKYDAGQNAMNLVPHNMKQLIEKYLNENREYIEEAGFEIEYRHESNVDYSVLVDSDSIETVLSNLTENAIKYSNNEKVILYRIFADTTHIIIEIEDHGVGIQKKELKNIFKKFYRVEETLVAKTKGHGLGLSIVKSLIELNKGRISVSSEYGKGTIFKIAFPKIKD